MIYLSTYILCYYAIGSNSKSFKMDSWSKGKIYYCVLLCGFVIPAELPMSVCTCPGLTDRKVTSGTDREKHFISWFNADLEHLN